MGLLRLLLCKFGVPHYSSIVRGVKFPSICVTGANKDSLKDGGLGFLKQVGEVWR